MKPKGRGGVAAGLHWGHAGLLLGLFALGWIMVGLPKGPDKAALFALHKSLGLLAAALLALRLAWQLRPRVRPGKRTPKPGLATVGRRLIYLMLLLTPLCGYLSTSFGRHPVRLFAYDLPKLGWPDDALSRFFAICHTTSGWVLLALVVLHLGTELGLGHYAARLAWLNPWRDKKRLSGQRSAQ
jgi:cytochrome b561